MEQETINFEKSNLPSDIIKVKVGKDGAPLMPPETLTLKIDYSDSVCTAGHYNAMKLASSVLPVSSISPLRVEFKKKPRSFTGTFILVDDKMARYEAQMLAVTVLPVFSKSILSITIPHVPFNMRNDFTKLYRNTINFFYKELTNRLSYPIRDPKWFPSLIK